MTESFPYVLQLKEAVSAIHLTNAKDAEELPQLSLLRGVEEEPRGVTVKQEEEPYIEDPGVNNYVYEIIYPEQMNLKPIYNVKRGRPKKKKVEGPPQIDTTKVVRPAPRTRSGRVVRFPKHIEKDFKKVELDTWRENGDLNIKVSNFTQYEEEPNQTKPETKELVYHQRRRKVASQYRCPKCDKAYLGKTKMIQHIKKYPDHGPIPASQDDLNFEVWNYLVDITQKCPPAQRGIKFCEELTNLLHNVSLLTSALFKEVESNKNYVEVDKVLGNAINLTPGQYKFNDNELYKDVTVLQLITNTDFFKPVNKVKDPCKEAEGSITVKQELEAPPAPPPPADFLVEVKQLDSKDSAPVHLLSENTLLNLRGSVDDDLLLPPGENGGALLDNSTSCDEVMNVDQFVNERFKKITEPDIENINLDLPTLDLFQFHAS